MGIREVDEAAMDWAIVGALAVRTSNGVGVALINMGRSDARTRVEAALASGANASDAAQHAAEGTEPSADFNGSVAYRRHVAKVLVGRALKTAGV